MEILVYVREKNATILFFDFKTLWAVGIAQNLITALD